MFYFYFKTGENEDKQLGDIVKPDYSTPVLLKKFESLLIVHNGEVNVSWYQNK